MFVEIKKRTIHTSGKFLSVNRAADIPVGYSVGYSYSTSLRGVSVRLTNEEHKHLELRMTPEEAELMAADIVTWAAKTREYQKTSGE